MEETTGRRGGRRPGSGRPRTRPHPGLIGPGVPHLRREYFEARLPVSVKVRMQPSVGRLSAQRRIQEIESALREAKDRGGMRIVHYAISDKELRLIVEADGAGALARGMQGVSVRIARRLNRLDERRGPVFVDRFAAKALLTVDDAAEAARELFAHARAEAESLSSARWLGAALPDDAPTGPARTRLLQSALSRLT
jgi:hypothetical protein